MRSENFAVTSQILQEKQKSQMATKVLNFQYVQSQTMKRMGLDLWVG